MRGAWFRGLLWLYPPSFRKTYGAEMEELYRQAANGGDLSTVRARLAFFGFVLPFYPYES